MATETLTLGHSPDPDDAFMHYALAAEKLDTGGLRFEHILQDIETLNWRAMREELDITAVSIHAYAYIQDEGWKRVFSGNPNSFYNILTQLINAKNKGTTVNVRIDNGVIVEIYS